MANTYREFVNTDWILESFSPSGLPVSTDKVICPANVSANRTDTVGNAHDIDLALLATHPLFHGQFGSLAAPIKSCADLIEIFGDGDFFFEATDDNASGLTVDDVLIAAANAGVQVVLTSDSPTINADYSRINAQRGRVTLGASIKFASTPIVTVGFVEDLLGDVHLTIAAGAPTLATLQQNGGRTELHNVITNLRIAAGTCVKDSAKAVNIEVLEGATLIYNHAASGTDVTLCEVHGGATLDLMQTSGEKVFVKTIAHPGAIIRYDTNLHTIVLTDYRTSRG